MQLEQHLKEVWGENYLIVSKAIAKYPTDGFVKTLEEKTERIINIIKEVKALKAVNSY